MGAKDYYLHGDYNALCFECGFKFKASELKRHWQGYYVCDSCWEPRHPQDFVRGVPDEQTPPWTQPKPEDTFVALCTPNSTTAYPGFAGPGCVIPGYINPLFDPSLE